MPLVDYRCEACGAVQEVFAPSPVPDIAECDVCGGAARRKFGLGGLLGVRPAKAAKDRLARERATATPLDAAERRRLGEHVQGHDHSHGHSHDHGHAHDHPTPQPSTTKEESL